MRGVIFGAIDSWDVHLFFIFDFSTARRSVQIPMPIASFDVEHVPNVQGNDASTLTGRTVIPRKDWRQLEWEFYIRAHATNHVVQSVDKV